MSLFQSLASNVMNYLNCKQITIPSSLLTPNPLNQHDSASSPLNSSVRVIQCPSVWSTLQTPLILLCLYCTILLLLLRCLTVCNTLAYSIHRTNRIYHQQQILQDIHSHNNDNNIANRNSNRNSRNQRHRGYISEIWENFKFSLELSWHLLVTFVCSGPDEDLDTIIDLSGWSTHTARNRRFALQQQRIHRRRLSNDVTQSPRITVTRRKSITELNKNETAEYESRFNTEKSESSTIHYNKSTPKSQSDKSQSDVINTHSLTYIEDMEKLDLSNHNNDSNSAINNSNNISNSVNDTVLIPTDPAKGQMDIDVSNSPCAICLCEFELEGLALVTDCQHVYHPSCLQRWADQQTHTDRGVNCPLCRRDLLGSETETEEN